MIYAGKKEDSRTSGIITIVVHAVIFLLIFFFMSFDLPDPPPAETYAELSLKDFGYSDTGSGNNEGAPTQASSAVAEETPEEAVVDNTAEVAANVVETPSTSTQPAQTQTQTQTQPQTQTQTQTPQQTASNALTDALNAMNSGGDGNDNTGGNVGTQTGQIDGKGVFGDGGNSYNLAGRGMTGEPKFSGKPTKNGRVVVKIDVNRSGKVINATVDQIKSNTTEKSLWDLAIKMAKTATFNNDQAANIQQRGTVTFTFKVN